MKHFFIAFLFHVFLYFTTFDLGPSLEFKRVGNPNVTVNMVGVTSNSKGENKAIPKEKKETKPKKKEKPKKEEKKVEKKVEKKKPLPKKEEVKKPTPPKDAKKEIVKEEKIVEETVEPIEVEEILETSNEEADEIVEETTSAPLKEGIMELEDGSLVAKNQGVKGLNYGFISEPEPRYPDLAKKMRYSKDVTIKVRFLIGYNGRVEDVRFYDDETKYGFREEVKKALSGWKATPITIDGQPVKLYFYKSFRFNKIK